MSTGVFVESCGHFCASHTLGINSFSPEWFRRNCGWPMTGSLTIFRWYRALLYQSLLYQSLLYQSRQLPRYHFWNHKWHACPLHAILSLATFRDLPHKRFAIPLVIRTTTPSPRAAPSRSDGLTGWLDASRPSVQGTTLKDQHWGVLRTLPINNIHEFLKFFNLAG